MKYLPNILTMLRIILLIPYVYFLMNDEFTIALIIFALAGITDGLDGFLARQFTWTSKFGAILDPLADKLLVISSLVVLYIIGAINIYVPIILIFRDIYIISGVTYIYFRDPDVLKFEPFFLSKLNTVLQLLLIFIILVDSSIYSIASWMIQLIMLTVIVTSIVSLLQYIHLGHSWLKSGGR